MPPKSKSPQGANDLRALIDLTKTTQDLLVHFQSSLTPSNTPPAQSTTSSLTTSKSTSAPEANSLDVIKATTTLLKSHTTTLSLLLLTPPLTPSAIISKIGDVSSGVLSGMVAAASSVPRPGQEDELGELMRVELKAQVRRLLGTWGEVLALILRFAERRQAVDGQVNGSGKGKGKDAGPTEAEKQDVLSTTGVLWEACDTLIKVCDSGIVELAVKKAGEWRSVLLDAVEELKEWGEDVNEEDEEDNAETSDAEVGEFGDEDDIFSAANKLGKGDKELKVLLDTSIKRLKMVGILYQAVIKRRLKTFPGTSQANVTIAAVTPNAMGKLDEVMGLLKAIPETVDDLASAFYDLDETEAKKLLGQCGDEAKSVIALVRLSWSGNEDEFTAWSDRWIAALEAS